MRIRVRHFASIRELLDRPEDILELPPRATAADAWVRLVAVHSELAARRPGLGVAINHRYAGFGDPLEDGDELVFLPPVGGG